MRERRALTASVAVVLLATSCGDSRQAQVAERGAEVMPFDLDATTHHFEPSRFGGVQTVIADDPANDTEVELVRDHLRQGAEAFSAGDYGDPVTIHGEDMPGVAELAAGAERVEIRYGTVDAGATLTFSTDDPALIAALHEWFEAQTSDHGGHAQRN